MGSRQSSSYSVDTIARDIVHVYQSNTIKHKPRKVVKPIRKRRAPQPPGQASRLKAEPSKGFNRIPLADMELQCDGEKCK